MEKIMLIAAAVTAACFLSIAPMAGAQICGYKPFGFIKTNAKLKRFLQKFYFILAIFCLIMAAVPSFSTAVIVVFGVFLSAVYLYRKANFLSGFKFTKRGVRLFLLLTAITAVEGALLNSTNKGYLSAGAVLAALSVFNVKLSLILIWPLESAIKKSYVKKTAAAIKNSNATVIGITGSYAKSSVKSYLTKILSEKFKTYCTIGNFNTPMGLSLSVKNMPKNTEYFVVEMGARRMGDIDEMCRIANPKHAIITGIAPQHLETFFTIENIMTEKGRLAEWIKEGGVVIANGLPTVKTDGEALILGKDVLVRNVKCSSEGTILDLVFEEKTIRLEMPLLGKHNAENVAIAAAMALKLGMNEDEVKAAANKLEPLPHRLFVQKSAEMTVIDDSYNANPKGVRAALEILKLFEGRKVVVTPGMVELGQEEQCENKTYGMLLAGVADFVALTGGKTSNYIEDGLKECGFQNYRRFCSLKDAEAHFGEILRRGDVVLFANDLTDNYL